MDRGGVIGYGRCMLGRLPAYATPLLGRDALLAEIRQRVATAGRPVTLVGPGGVGKTRLAVDLVEGVPDACFVDLRRCTTPVQAIEAVAQALGVGGDSGAASDIARVLQGRPRLVVLDNLEQLEGVSEVFEPWIRQAVGVQWLFTSRVPLDLPDACQIGVPPLVDADDARALFMACVPLRWRGRVEVERVDRIVRGLGGYPLALELAARRLEILEASQLEDSLAEAFFSTLSDPLHPEGAHASLREVIRQTVAVLPPPVSEILGALAVFTSPFDYESARAVAGEGTLDALAILLQRGLLTRSEALFSMTEPVRRFVEDGADARRWADIRFRLATWLASRAAALSLPAKRGDPDALSEIELRFSGLREVLRAAAAGDLPAEYGVDAASALLAFLGIRPPATLRLRIVEEALLLPEAPSRREVQLEFPMVHAWWIWKRGSHAEGLELLVRANRNAEGAPAALAQGLNMEARMRSVVGEDTLPLLERSWRLAVASGLLHLGVMSLVHRSYAHFHAGDFDLAWTVGEEALRHAEASGYVRSLNEVHLLLGYLALRKQRFDAARRWYGMTIESARALGDRRRLAHTLCEVAIMDEIAGELDEASAVFDFAHRTFTELDAPRLTREALSHRGRVALELGDVETAARLLAGTRAPYISGPSFDALIAAARGDREGFGRWRAKANPSLEPWLEHIAVLLDPTSTAPLALECPTEPFLIPFHRAAAQVDAIVRRKRGDEVSVAADGTWVISNGQQRHFSDGSPNVRVLRALVTARGRTPLDVEALFSAGWPDQKATPAARRNRVNVALSTLRKAGLKGTLERSGDGWRLPDGLVVV